MRKKKFAVFFELHINNSQLIVDVCVHLILCTTIREVNVKNRHAVDKQMYLEFLLMINFISGIIDW